MINILDYLNQTLGLTATMIPWKEADQFPLYLRDGRKYSLLRIGGVECVLIEADEKKFSLPTFCRQMAKLPAEPAYIVLCFKHLNSRQRKALIEAQMPFIVPGSQVYLPFLGIVLQERMKPVKIAPERFSPASQLLLLYLIYEPAAQPIRKVDLAKRLELSAMNVTRAVQELEVLELVTVEKSGRSDYVSALDSGKSLYKKALPHMVDPAQKRIYVKDGIEFASLPLAGESALAERSMLAFPAVACRAISRKAYKQLSGVEEIDPAWSGSLDYIQLELWKYDPKILAGGTGVDVISLTLSLRESSDERVEQSVEEMMEGYKW